MRSGIVKCIICLLLVSTLFTGCSFQLSSSIDDLIAPITPFDNNATISSTLDSYLSGSYTLKTPKTGDYTSSFVQYDLEGDGINEAFAFYEPSNDLGTIYMAVLKCVDKKWSVISAVKTSGSDISEIAFADINGDGNKNILVNLEVLSNQSTHILTIYKLSNNKSNYKIKKMYDNINLNNFVTLDYNDDKTDEVMVFKIDNVDAYDTKAVLYSFKNGTESEIGETKLDGNISSYAQITVENTKNGFVVYADAYKNDNSAMITEIIHWSNYYDTIISPFYSYASGVNKSTYRDNTLVSKDINDDGIMEIPLNSNVCKVKGNIIVVDWCYYKVSVLAHRNYSIVNKQDGYQLLFPNKYKNKISANYDSASRVLTVKDKNGDVMFTITAILESQYNGSDKDKSIIAEESGYYCVADIKDKSAVTLDELKENIKDY